jgi:hypothetical protein
MDTPKDQTLELDLRVRAQFLRNLFSRLTIILRIHSEGYILILYEQVDEVYIKLRSSIESILETEGLETLANAYPKDVIPTTLHSLGEDIDVYWDSLKGVLINYTGQIIEFCVSVGADNSNIDSAIKSILTSYDEFIESFEKEKKQSESKWLQRSEAAGKQFQKQFDQKLGTKTNTDEFVNATRLSELRATKSKTYDLTRLTELCDELNKTIANECYMAVAMLVRAILDHVPPIFACKYFAEVANNYNGGSKSFKQSMTNLESSSRKIADAHLHTQIRSKEILPNKTQVNFSNDLDVLLAEIVRLLK